MAFLAYPEESLPPPETGTFERVQATTATDVAKGPNQYALRERAFRGFQDVTFLFNAEQAKAFRRFWELDLLRGGAPFTTRWPLPSGWYSPLGVRKFIEPPRWSHVGMGAWRVSARTELVAVQLPLYPTFTTTPYPITSLEELEVHSLPTNAPTAFSIEALAPTATAIFGTLGVKLIPLTAPFEMVTSSATVLSGTIVQFTFAQYSFREIVASRSRPMSGTMKPALIRYSFIPEPIQSRSTVISGTLT